MSQSLQSWYRSQLADSLVERTEVSILQISLMQWTRATALSAPVTVQSRSPHRAPSIWKRIAKSKKCSWASAPWHYSRNIKQKNLFSTRLKLGYMVGVRCKYLGRILGIDSRAKSQVNMCCIRFYCTTVSIAHLGIPNRYWKWKTERTMLPNYFSVQSG